MDDPIDNAAFAHPGMVRDLVRLLPRKLTEDLDLRTLRRLPSANVGKGAERRLADMPLSLGFRPSAGRPPQARLLLMLEFQSAVDRHMALQRCGKATDLPARVAALFELLRGPGDASLRRDLRDVLGGMIAKRFGGAGADMRLALKLMEEPMSLATRFDEWEAEFLQKGHKQGRKEGREAGLEEGWAADRRLLRRQAVRRFDAATAEALFGMLADVRDAERFAEVGEFIVDCATGPELLDQVRRTNGRFE